VALAFSTPGHARTEMPSWPVKLSAQEMKTVARLACRPNPATGDVHSANCSKTDQKWVCADHSDAARVTLSDGREISVTRRKDISKDEQVVLLEEAVKLRGPMLDASGSQVVRGACQVTPRADSAFRGATLFDITCSRGALAVLVRDCWEAGCRYFLQRSEISYRTED
jgi:hypothetical protein